MSQAMTVLAGLALSLAFTAGGLRLARRLWPAPGKEPPRGAGR
jgi:hypothetical protein